uniref:Uncharacterized protein n=1 Tax=Tanacetum cinerariifolium TaxID=118510 RepID=A0A6L2JD92_TANCI|nr:hypothetical protein [Tanacetum cinerariifolium]
MTIPRPTPFPATIPRAGVFAPFVIISDSDNEITTLPVRPAPPSPNRTPTLYGYPLDSGDDSSDEDLSETAESLHTQTTSTSVVHPPLARPLATSPTFSRRPRKGISMPSVRRVMVLMLAVTAGWRWCRSVMMIKMVGWRASVGVVAEATPTAVPQPPKHIELIGDDIETMRASLASAMQEKMTLRARVGSLEQHDVVTRESLRIARARITWSQLRVEYAEQEVKELREFRVTNRFEMTELRSRAQGIEASFWDHERHLGP